MEGPRLPKRFILAVNNLYPHNTIPFIPLRCKKIVQNESDANLFAICWEMQPIFMKQR